MSSQSDNPNSPIVQEYHLFPTLVVNLQYQGPEIAALNEQLIDLIKTDQAYENKPVEQLGSDDVNMNDHAATHGCMEAVLQMFARGVDEWLRAAGCKGKGGYTSKISTFPSYLLPGQASSPHNHARTELVGIYYVSCAPTSEPPIKICDHGEWYRQDDGPLWLLDPRFNATLTELSETMCAKLFPRPGLLAIFPGYLWHGVGPNRSDQIRYAISANISVVRDNEPVPNERSFHH